MAGKKTITQRISLEGGDTIEKQLKSLGDAGEKAFKDIQAAANKANFDKFTASLSKLRSDLATFGRNIALLGAGLTAAAGGAGAAIIGLTKSGAEAADQAGKNAQKVGLQVDAYGELEFAAKQADVSQETLVSSMSKLNKQIAEAASQTAMAGHAIDDSGVTVTRYGSNIKKAGDATKQAGNIFEKLGVKIRDANGNLRSNRDILLDVAAVFSRMPDGVLKSALAIELFGKAGAEIIPFLNQGKEGIRDLGKEAEKLGLIFTPAEAALGDELGDTLDSLGAAIFGIKRKLGLLFAPIVLEGAKALRDLIVENKDAILAFGAEAARVTAGVLGDLLHLLTGNTDAIKNPWIREWGAAIVKFGQDVVAVVNTVVLPLFKAVREGAQFVAEQINKIFNTDMNGDQLLIGAVILGIIGFFTLLGSAISAVIIGLGLFGDAAVAIAAGAVGLGIIIAAFWDDIKAGAAGAWQFVADGATAAWASIVQGATDLWAQIVAAFQDGQQMAVAAFNAIVESIVNTWSGLIDQLGSIAQQIVDRIANWFGTLPQRITSIFNSLVGIASNVLGRVSSLVDSIVSKIKSAIEFAKQLAGLGGGDSGGGSSPSGFARGGYLGHGPGTATSDSILARLSVGEFVVRAAVVKKLGAGFFHMLNNGLMPNIEAFRGVAKGFSVGGLADSFNRSMSPQRFAAGGLAKIKLGSASPGASGATTHVKLDFGLGPDSVFDLITDDFVASRLQSFALRQAYASVGRRPGSK